MNGPESNYQGAPISRNQELVDVEKLNALTVCHYILGSVMVLFEGKQFDDTQKSAVA
ncbi:MAG: hypothetical protein ACRYFS_13570 [Janthinobacterium lividum]